MATTYTSAAAAGPAPEFRGRGISHSVYGEYTLTSAAELGTINNVIEMVRVPKGARVIGLLAEMVDNDGGSSFTLDIGDGGDVDRLVAASTVGQSAGYVVNSDLVKAQALGYVYTQEDTIDFLVHAAPASAAATSGKVRLIVHYVMD